MQIQFYSKDDQEDFNNKINKIINEKEWNYFDEASSNFINKIKRSFAFVPSRGKKLQERFNFQGSRGK
ncbi:Hypothetical protein SRAE_1000252400 [Strongyloides ratti]|uniref:Type II toxin-antitoxin system RelE/ParE family toxin n=1 Tax=Strongyloides ratti TaxID=34506 RepID=A0A090MWU0_STRRB|nr:Hypothetical protein SRAE_1000252400 [Strongyloides ratti]CEF64269.1 Hypothetical protein SRAE_1000252400 [Strongyloides ratti]